MVGLHFGRFFTNSSGTDVMIFKIFSPKNSAKKLAFLTQNKAEFSFIFSFTYDMKPGVIVSNTVSSNFDQSLQKITTFLKTYIFITT
jgi:hypothetical protein